MVPVRRNYGGGTGTACWCLGELRAVACAQGAAKVMRMQEEAHMIL